MSRHHAGDRAQALSAHPRWWQSYATRILLTDSIAIYVAVFTAYAVRFDADGSARVAGELAPSYLAVSVALMWAWIFCLVVGRAQDRRLVGAGPAEYQRVFSVTWRLFASVAVVAYLGRMEIGRGFLGLAFPLGLLLLLLGRYGWRQWLRRRRNAGRMLSQVLVVGLAQAAGSLIEEMRSRSGSGFEVVGLCVAESDLPLGALMGVPVLGTMADAAAIARTAHADVVAVVGSDATTADAVRRLGWDLEGSGIDIALAMSLHDVAGPRVLLQPVNGLPLMYIDEPYFTGPKYALKTAFDLVGAACALIVLAPALLVVAVVVMVSSPGPIFYRQSRIGVNGRAFPMLKFRSMVDGAHSHLDEVLQAEGVEHVGLFYKPKNDPRVTGVGRVLRRFSVDELPQLFNVFRGEMSLVGPRPQIDREVALYGRSAKRRLLVKPGLTGLWQVSGRSGLTADESIRIDVYYVENWTLFGDVLIMAKTLKAVLGGEGAY